ncbi:MAG: hypothetical protein E6I95_15220 [Chloroflexi bacterium]|nr:MAG: hypothetical protein E6I95_15220 [Chloroflexota bacterium]
MRSLLLKFGATVLTLGTTLASAMYVTAHLKNPSAPLQPTVLASQSSTAAVTVTPGVRQTDVQPVTSTYAS